MQIGSGEMAPTKRIEAFVLTQRLNHIGQFPFTPKRLIKRFSELAILAADAQAKHEKTAAQTKV
jgi:hypothetical protein